MTAPPTPAPSATAATGYRRDLDGLRGIAIALVVLFHVYVGRVSGGVDVFLLLSGFFFLGSQIRNADRPGTSINPWWSLWRTLRRLYPALVTVIAASTVLAAFVAPALRTREMAEQILAPLVYAQNLKLTQKSAEYGAAAYDISPLQHLWSMAVQFQFYVFAILVVAAIAWFHRRRGSRPGAVARTALPLLAAGTAISFAIAVWLHRGDQLANYYSTPARFRELGLGGLLMLVLARRAAAGRGPLLGDRGARLAAPAGLLLIAATGLVIDGAAEFLGPLTLLPLGGAVLVVLAGARPGPTTTFLESRPVTFLGDIAYSLYLWHWPLLIIATNLLGDPPPDPLTGTVIIAVSVALAWATHRLVEKPLQQHRRRPAAGEPVIAQAITGLRTRRPARLRALGGVAVAAVAAACLALTPATGAMMEHTRTTRPDPAAYPGAAATADGASAPAVDRTLPAYPVLADDDETPRQVGCLSGTEDPLDHVASTGSDGRPCVYGDPEGDRTMVLIGGSHSAHWFGALDEVARNRGWRLELRLRDACPPAFGRLPGMPEYCDGWAREQLEGLAEDRPDLVVSTTTRPRPGGGDEVPAGYRAFWDEVAGLGIPVLGFRDHPWTTDGHGTDHVAASCVVAGGDPVDCGPDRAATIDEVDDGAEMLAAYPDSLQVDFTDVLCGPEKCPAVIGNLWVYRDDDHLATTFVKTLAPELDRRVGGYLDGLAARA
ncbi:acyltransferase family protein [Corynebacterium sp. 335C]